MNRRDFLKALPGLLTLGLLAAKPIQPEVAVAVKMLDVPNIGTPVFNSISTDRGGRLELMTKADADLFNDWSSAIEIRQSVLDWLPKLPS